METLLKLSLFVREIDEQGRIKKQTILSEFHWINFIKDKLMVFHLVIQRAGMHNEPANHRWMNAVPLLRVELQQQYNGTLKTTLKHVKS